MMMGPEPRPSWAVKRKVEDRSAAGVGTSTVTLEDRRMGRHAETEEMEEEHSCRHQSGE